MKIVKMRVCSVITPSGVSSAAPGASKNDSLKEYLRHRSDSGGSGSEGHMISYDAISIEVKILFCCFVSTVSCCRERITKEVL